MKTTTMIIAALFTLQASVLLAGNESISVTPVTEVSTSVISKLAPSTPAEATFEESETMIIDVEALAPVVPVQAEFEEDALFRSESSPIE